MDLFDRVLVLADLSFHRDGLSLTATVRPSTREADAAFTGRIWRFHLDGSSEQLTDGPNDDALPRNSPVDDRVAFVSDRAVKGKKSLFVLESGVARPLGDIPGTIEDLRWVDDGSAWIALAADRGLDGGATDAAMRLWWEEPDDPAVTNPAPRRRLFRVAADGTTTEVGPVALSVWEFDLAGSGAAFAIVSEDASERGWYHARLARLDFATREATILHSSRWQLQSPAASPDGQRVAFLEGWSSDRGLVASAIRILDPARGVVTTLDAAAAQNVTTLEWRDEASLTFAGWAKLGSTYGVIGTDNAIVWAKTEDAVIGTNSFSASVVVAPDKTGLAAVRETVGSAPEVVFRTSHTAEWQQITRLNEPVTTELTEYPEVRRLAWTGVDGLEIEGLVLLPRSRQTGRLPMIVEIHGGPSWAAKYSFDPVGAAPFAAAGYAVFLPNYRGNAGWGQDFAKLNIGDPGGAEFRDILTGVDRCVAEGIADADRLGVTGGSYGGYMTAWAVTTTDRFKAAVMVSGIADQLSCHYSCNHDFHAFINGGPLTEPAARAIALDRSPLTRLAAPTTPTLIIHGAEDRCTPLGQGQALYGALRERGCPAEIVVYPREGHGLREREHRRDARARTIAWFDKYLRP